MPDVTFSCYWDKSSIKMTQDHTVKEAMEEYLEECEQTWEMFREMMEAQFDPKYINKELFMNIFAQVCTRCFGHFLDSTAMVPMADNLNHSSV